LLGTAPVLVEVLEEMLEDEDAAELELEDD